MLICDPKVGCSDVDSNPKQCGSCGNVCSPTQTCVQGQCTSLCDLGPSHFSKFSWADWQGMNWMTAVKNQGACGSCWAFGPVSVTEAMFNIEHRSQKNLDISEEELVSPCFASGISGDCLGGDYGGSLKYLKSSGLVSETAYPYTSGNEAKSVPNAGDPAHSHLECKVQKSHCSTPAFCNDNLLGTTRWGITSSAFLPVNANNKPDNINEMKKELLCHGPLVVGSSNWWHVVALVGWDDSTQQWTIKNSWGTDPATNYDGYEKIHYYNDFNSDIMNSSAWVQGVTGQ
jgi:C1A family cysteine protease